MSSDGRRHLRLALPAEILEDFDRQKEKAEDQAMMQLSDSKYAVQLIRWALSKKE